MCVGDLFETPMQNASDIQNFIFAGKSMFTIVSKKTGNRFTYKVTKGGKKSNEHVRFVHVLVGPSNTDSYQYIGYMLENSRERLIAGRKGKANIPCFDALNWLVRNLNRAVLPEQIEFYHSGQCGACGRVLTDPHSIKVGLGPICEERISG